MTHQVQCIGLVHVHGTMEGHPNNSMVSNVTSRQHIHNPGPCWPALLRRIPAAGTLGLTTAVSATPGSLEAEGGGDPGATASAALPAPIPTASCLPLLLP